MTQHASPRWPASKIYIEGLPKEQREKKIEQLCWTYPTWFFELWVEFEGGPLILQPFQIDYLLDDSRFKITNKTRQAGGSLQLSLAKFFKAYTQRNYRCDIVSINLKEAADKIRYIKSFYETLPKRYRAPLEVDNALSIGFHKGTSNRSIVNSLAASAGIRGNKKDVVFDEFAHIVGADELFRSALPAIIRKDDLGVDLVSTPRGKHNMFGEIWLNEPDPKGKQSYNMFSRHQFIWVDVPKFVKSGKYEEARHVWKYEYEENMNRMEELVDKYASDELMLIVNMYPWEWFLQEFCGVLLDDTLAVFSWDLITQCLHPPFSELEDQHDDRAPLEPWLERPDGNTNDVVMGADFGKSGETNDKTSIQIVERCDDGTLRHRFSKNLARRNFPDFPAQAEEIARIATAFRVDKIEADATGLGLGIVPLIQRLVPWANVVENEFNNTMKTEMVMNMKSLMEQGNLWIMEDEKQLQAEIHGIQRTPLPSGKDRYHGEPHDDMFWAMALAVKDGSYKHFAMYTIDSLLSSMREGA